MTRTDTATLALAAARALTGVLPTGASLTPRLHTTGGFAGATGKAVVATFVGAVSADLAVVLADVPELVDAAAEASPVVAVQDVLQPALEAAQRHVRHRRARTTPASKTPPPSSPTAETVVFELAGPTADRRLVRRAHPSERTRTLGGPVDARYAGKLGRISNVEMALTVEIGRTRMSVRDVLAMEPGAVIELDRSAGSPADVLLNGRLIAHGEIVVVDQDYAVRITKILDVAEDLD